MTERDLMPAPIFAIITGGMMLITAIVVAAVVAADVSPWLTALVLLMGGVGLVRWGLRNWTDA